MDQFNRFQATGNNASYDSWNDSQLLQGPNSGGSLPQEDFSYSSFLVDELYDQFGEQQSVIENKASTPDALAYDELMNMDFRMQNEYLGDTDLFALPSDLSIADNQSPAVVPQPLENAYFSDNISYTSPIPRMSPFVALPTIITTEAPQQEPVGLYRNPILNLFTDPATPLSVIESFQYPFEHELQVALEQALQRQQTQESFQAGYLAATKDLARRNQEDRLIQQEFQDYLSSLPHMVSAPTSTPAAVFPPVADFILGPAPTSAPEPVQDDIQDMSDDEEYEVDEKKHGNKRPLNIKNFDPTKFYKPLASTPESWASTDPKTNQPLFRYTAFGELNPLSTFTPSQIAEYIGKHPLNDVSGSNQDSGLTLLIQTVPADSGRRYPNKASDKCRFSCCPDHLRTIRKGDLRVAFDEQTSQNSTSDPYHNAGYVHLFCLEKFLDFPQLCKDFNVRPDIRVLPEGKNKMAITRDHASMEGIVETFMDESVPWSQFGEGIRPEEYYSHTLNYMLTKEHLKKQPKHLQRIREKRGGISIDLHMNNLDVYVEKRSARKQEQAAERAPKKGKKNKKRTIVDLEDEESADDLLDKDILQRAFSRPSKKLRR